LGGRGWGHVGADGSKRADYRTASAIYALVQR
jgi:hypothetical protein